MKHRQFARIGLLLLSTQLSVVAATYTVDMTTDDITATACNATVINDCSLSGAMSIVANGDTIDFYLLANSMITLTDALPQIDSNLTIDGSSVSGLTISGNNNYRPFHITSDANVTMQGLKIVSGNDSAIYNEGNLTIVESTLSGNVSSTRGGAISTVNNSRLKIVDSNLSSNRAAQGGGAINAHETETGIPGSHIEVSISGSHINDNNNSERGGGAIYFYTHYSKDAGTLEVSTSTISGNHAAGVGGEGGEYGKGGAISITNTNLSINDSVLSDNSATYSGGAIDVYSINSSFQNIENTTISGNQAKQGGALNIGDTDFSIHNSTISDNSSDESGGAIDSKSSELNISNSTISDNNANYAGGAIRSTEGSNTRLKNCTISGNKATIAGGIYQEDGGTLKITHTTITNNTQTSTNFGSGGIYLYNGPSSATIKNSIITGNISPTENKDCFHDDDTTLTSEGFNIVTSPGNCNFTVPGDLIGAAPDIGSLADNGGPTKTHAIIPTPGNIAWNTGVCDDIDNNPVLADQRGEPRPDPVDFLCDIGAFEFGVDTDSDGLDDLTEIAYGTNPTVADSDSDGINDGDEVYKYKTDPLKFDTDGDGAGDGDEIAAGTDPLDPNSYPFVGISPIEFLFGKSGTTDFSITNTTANDITLPAAALQGPDGGNTPAGFSIASDACTGTLPAGQSCTIQVAYTESNTTSRSAFLQIDGVKLTAFLHNYEGLREEAVRRLPAVVGSLDFNRYMYVREILKQ